ncbi:hypothetical protein HA402_006560, partial [Bradysia odoriphaga]
MFDGLIALGNDGGNLNVGGDGGINHLIEEELGCPLHYWFVCLLHTNELHLKNLINKLDGCTSSSSTFPGPIGKSLENVSLPVVKFKRFRCSKQLSEIPDDVFKKLSNDQMFQTIRVSVSNTDSKTRARILAITQKESGGWLQALPSPHLSTLLDSDSLRIIAGIRLGAHICQPYTCICGYPVDSFGTHGLSCIKKKGTFFRHILLNDLILKALSPIGEIGINPIDRPDGSSEVHFFAFVDFCNVSNISKVIDAVIASIVCVTFCKQLHLIHADVKLYDSLRFAENCECLCLAYANRSLCFLKLKYFDRCFKDIDDAIKNKYPENLMPKLLKRKIVCMQQSERQSQKICFGPSLSYDADLHLPCIANVLKIEVNDQYGRLVTAGCNIDIGDTLLIEQAYIRVSTGNECYNCAEKKCSLIPYVTCTDVMFCSEECSHNDFHSVECNIIFHSDETFGIKSSSFVLRSIMAGINAFKNIDDMMQFIDDCRSTDSKEISTSFATPESRYRSFFKLSSFGNLGDVRDQASSIFHGMVRSKDLAIKFDSPKKRRFLIHLICHHTLIVRTNGFGGLCDPSDSVLKSSVQPTENQFERNIFLAAS